MLAVPSPRRGDSPAHAPAGKHIPPAAARPISLRSWRWPTRFAQAALRWALLLTVHLQHEGIRSNNRALVEGMVEKVLRFALHDLKQRGIADSDDKGAGGHMIGALRQLHDHSSYRSARQ